MARGAGQPGDVVGREVAHTDRANLSGVGNTFERTPGIHDATSNRPMHEIEIHVFQTEAIKAMLERLHLASRTHVVVP